MNPSQMRGYGSEMAVRIGVYTILLFGALALYVFSRAEVREDTPVPLPEEPQEAVTTPTSTPVSVATSAPIFESETPKKEEVPKISGATGGLLEPQKSSAVRPRTDVDLPADRSAFMFPSPYGTRGYRITIPSDCGGRDCVHAIGYSYWSNMNNSAGSDTAYVFVSLDVSRGGEGPTLFAIDKKAETVRKIGPLFAENDLRRYASGEGWYFSLTNPSILYVHPRSTSPTLERYDIFSRATEVVFDISHAEDVFGKGRYVFQLHSSADGAVHSFTVKDINTYASLGCGVYQERTDTFKYYPKTGEYDECQIDKMGRYLVIKEQVDGTEGEDNRIIDLDTDKETRVYDKDGAAGHSDHGYGYMIAADNWYREPVWRGWRLGTDPLGPGTITYREPQWETSSIDHISWNNARTGSLASQYLCGSAASRKIGPRTNEIVCFRADGTGNALVVAPVMTDLDARGGGDDYTQAPKGNLDPTGEYFIWSSNMGGDRLDVFVVRIPYQKLFE